MRTVIFILLLSCCCLCIAQETYRTESGKITFDASTPLEDIYALNEQVNAALKDNGEIAVLLLVEEFEFKRKLMQEHFNENYIESEKYPKAYFVGNISDYNPDILSAEPHNFEVKGNLTMHGVTRPITAELTVRRNGETVGIETEFLVRTEDYKIRIPRLLFKKIAEEVRVQVSATLAKS